MKSTFLRLFLGKCSSKIELLKPPNTGNVALCLKEQAEQKFQFWKHMKDIFSKQQTHNLVNFRFNKQSSLARTRCCIFPFIVFLVKL